MLGEFYQVTLGEEIDQKTFKPAWKCILLRSDKGKLGKKLFRGSIRSLVAKAIFNVMAQDVRNSQVKKLYFASGKQVFCQQFFQFLQRYLLRA